MNANQNDDQLKTKLTLRGDIVHAAAAVGGLVVGSNVLAKAQQMAEVQSTGTEGLLTYSSSGN